MIRFGGFSEHQYFVIPNVYIFYNITTDPMLR